MERGWKVEHTRRADTSGILLIALAAVCAFSNIGPATAGTAEVQIAKRYGIRTAQIRSVGTMYNGVEEKDGGSGLLIGDRYVLTNNHVVPIRENYRKLEIEVRLQSRNASPLQVKSVERDEANDLALLELDQPVVSSGGPTRCPMPVLDRADQAPMGSALILLGFPLDEEIAINNGIISNQSGSQSRWLTNTVMNPGNSGGPAFNEFGALLGIAVGGVVDWTFGGQTVRVSGVNFIIPTTVIRSSSLYPTIEKLTPPSNCWTLWKDTMVEASNSSKLSTILGDNSFIKEIQAKIAIPDVLSSRQFSLPAGTKAFINNVPQTDANLPASINRAYTVAETKDDHPVVLGPHSSTYTKLFAAEPGYKVSSCTWQEQSANHASDFVCNVAPGGKEATFAFRLTSGPQVDRWRGWWAGSVTIRQTRQ